MAYSTLNKSSFGDCTQCGMKNTDCVKQGKVLICLSCNRINKAKKQLAKQREKTQVRKLIHTDSNLLLVEQKKELELWFKTIMMKECVIFPEPNYYLSGCGCWECGENIPIKYFRAATAHALPKRKLYGFPSVAVHPKNYLILGAGCGCHQKYDNSWEDAMKMKVWGIALRKIKEIYPFIHPMEHKNLPEILLKEIHN